MKLLLFHLLVGERKLVLRTDSYVKILRDDTFDLAISEEKWVLFFQHGSFHQHEEMNVNIDYLAAKYKDELNIGYIDCTTEKSLCEKYNIYSTSPIKYVSNNVIHDFYGRQSLRALIEMCNSLKMKPITYFDTKETYTEFVQSAPVVFICVYNNETTSQNLLNEFRNVSQNLLLYATFGATNSSLTEFASIQPPFVVRLEEDVDSSYYTGKEDEGLLNWVKQQTLPTLPEYRGMAYSDIVRSNKLTFLLVLNSAFLVNTVQMAEMKHMILSLPVRYKKEIAYAYLDGEEWNEYLTQYGIQIQDAPCGIVISERSGKYYKTVKLEREAIQNYLDAIINKSLSPVLSSSIRYYVTQFMNSFMKLPFITRFFLSLSFTFALAAATLKVIFFFTLPRRVPSKVQDKYNKID